METTLSRLGAVALLAALPACSNTPQLDQQFGLAAKYTLQQQILDPRPPASRSVAGIDGKAAKSAQDNYEKSFKDPVPQTGALAIGVAR